MPPPTDPSPGAPNAEALVVYAFDLGYQIDLIQARERVRASRAVQLEARRTAPAWLAYDPPPLRLELHVAPLEVGPARTLPEVVGTLYDFGGLLLTFSIPLPDDLGELPTLGRALYSARDLEAAARDLAESTLEVLGHAVSRPRLYPDVEDYVIYCFREWDADLTARAFLERHRGVLAQAVEAEVEELSDEQVDRTLAARLSYTERDVAAVDWNAAILIDPYPDDTITVLQHVNAELLQLRLLDRDLDGILDRADATLASVIEAKRWPTSPSQAVMQRVALAQTELAVQFEGAHNAIKLFGNPYLARFHRLAAQALDLPAWEASVRRKLDASDALQQRIADMISTRRLETLEWVIIVLIALSMLLPFVPGYH
jgi:hypothetical protein